MMIARLLTFGLFWISLPLTLIAQTDYQEMEVSNGGMIRGTVRWKGSVPELDPIPVKKDQATCGNAKPSPCLKLGKGGGVADAIVFLEGITRGKKMPPASSKVVLDQINCEYVPHVLMIPAGVELEIANSDPLLHNVHFYEEPPAVADASRSAKRTVFNLAFPIKGQKIKKTFTVPGMFLSLCDAGHPWMSAHIFVIRHPYYALTDGEGKYSLEQVPPGSYRVRMWHEGIPNIQDANTPYLSAPPFEATKQVIVKTGEASGVDFELNLP